MKQYRVKAPIVLFATDTMTQYDLHLSEGALLIHCEDCPLPYAQTSIFERIMPWDLETVSSSLEEVEATSLKDVSAHNTINKLTSAKNRS